MTSLLKALSIPRVLLVSLAVFVIASLGVAVVVSLAFVVGKALARLFSFTAFEATLLSLLGFAVLATVVGRAADLFLKLGEPVARLSEDAAEDEDEGDEEPREEEPPSTVTHATASPAHTLREPPSRALRRPRRRR